MVTTIQSITYFCRNINLVEKTGIKVCSNLKEFFFVLYYFQKFSKLEMASEKIQRNTMKPSNLIETAIFGICTYTAYPIKYKIALWKRKKGKYSAGSEFKR